MERQLEIRKTGDEKNSELFDIKENSAGGNCLFLSLVDFMNDNKDKFKNIPNEKKLRQQAANYVLFQNSVGFQTNWDRFKDNIIFNLQNKIECLSRYGENEIMNNRIKKAYVEYMSQDGIYGTFSELSSIAEIYNFAGQILQRDNDDHNKFICYDFGLTGNQEMDKLKPKAFLFFDGPVDDGHFRRLIPKKQNTTPLLPTGNYMRNFNKKSTRKSLSQSRSQAIT